MEGLKVAILFGYCASAREPHNAVLSAIATCSSDSAAAAAATEESVRVGVVLYNELNVKMLKLNTPTKPDDGHFARQRYRPWRVLRQTGSVTRGADHRHAPTVRERPQCPAAPVRARL
ncbi:UNVERIFIED_CONTAM: hypothetical protein HDU68_007890 [Siphonaria sp. JEL0065]|nr:hypothetical protein HDU68_007890 [Siphonaria sp. JEL0065]